MPNAAPAIAAVQIAAASAGRRDGASSGCAVVFLQSDTPAHARAFAGTAGTRRRQIN